MSSKWRLSITVAGLTALVLVAAIEPALAAAAGNRSNTTTIGKNLGNEIKSWAGPLLLGVAGLAGIPAILKKDMNQSLVVLMITLVVGGFVLAEGIVKSLIRGVWKVIGG